MAPSSWMHLPRRTVRLRLTALYGGLFLASGAGLLVITNALVANNTSSAFFSVVGVRQGVPKAIEVKIKSGVPPCAALGLNCPASLGAVNIFRAPRRAAAQLRSSAAPRRPRSLRTRHRSSPASRPSCPRPGNCTDYGWSRASPWR